MGGRTEKRIVRIGGIVWKSGYVVLGIIALSYFTWMSTDKKAFSARHDTGIWLHTYELDFSGEESDSVEERVSYPLHVLKTYDR